MSNPEIGRTIMAGEWLTNYHDVGEGDPVVLIHGSGPGVSAWANWQFTIPQLLFKFRVIAPDMVGFGYTKPPVDPITDKGVWINHLLSLIDALKLDKVSLVGNSFGGAIAVAFAIAHPDRVKRIVLMGAATLDFKVTEGLDFVWNYQPSLENMERALGYLAWNNKRITPELIRLRYEASIRPEVQESYASTFGRTDRQACLSMLVSEEKEVASIEHECLILHGSHDQVIPVDVSVRLGGLIKHSDLHLFGDCGHWVQIERANSFNAIVANFLDKGLS
ncbi:alpha/beta hydrolase [Paraburkholderia sp. CNPSo 3076]|uniref:alpha/beta fold hydrolase n=1 Tax=Paraburkholderia sp. CNPSo 3076 TaxID=2940936 RepID=UPI00224F3EEE|nr:alpha/beta hydrolase [Paraburkholderia sp. CNPSo 3076]MCX5542123.1 alpha/beta hydrolase [Paraburkholderia sp. CNPSo 3076]